MRLAVREIGLSILSTAFAFTIGCTSDGCGAPVAALLRVTNSSGGTRSSNIRGQLTNGQDMTFASTSGEGGERGSWLPTPESEIADGIVDFPPGDRVWPVHLPQLPPGEFGFRLSPISCGQDHLEITVTFTVASS